MHTLHHLKKQSLESKSLTWLNLILYMCLNLAHKKCYLQIFLLDGLSEFGDDTSRLS